MVKQLSMRAKVVLAGLFVVCAFFVHAWLGLRKPSAPEETPAQASDEFNRLYIRFLTTHDLLGGANDVGRFVLESTNLTRRQALALFSGFADVQERVDVERGIAICEKLAPLAAFSDSAGLEGYGRIAGCLAPTMPSSTPAEVADLTFVADREFRKATGRQPSRRVLIAMRDMRARGAVKDINQALAFAIEAVGKMDEGDACRLMRGVTGAVVDTPR